MVFFVEDSDDEVSELTSNARSHLATLTSESVKKFMKNVNRIRFNSLTASNNIEPEKGKFGSKRSRSCPQFPKVETMADEDDIFSRSASTTCQDKSQLEITFVPEITESQPEILEKPVAVPPAQIKENVCDISISSTSSTVLINQKEVTTVTVTSTQSSEVTVAKCPMYSGIQSSTERRDEANDFVQLMRQVLNMPSATTCAKCQGHIDRSQTGKQFRIFCSFKENSHSNKNCLM